MAQPGRASVCGTEDCRFKSYHPPLGRITFFKKNKVQKKVFKKKTQLITIVTVLLKFLKNVKFLYKVKNLIFYRLYTENQQGGMINVNIFKKNTFTVDLCQKRFNLKSTISESNNKILNTFSIGSVIKYFKVVKGKYVRRSGKGTKVFLNFIKNILHKKYVMYLKRKNTTTVIRLNGVNNNLIFAQKTLKGIFTNKNLDTYILINSRISFTKTKDKRIKAIKKRLKKKLILRSLFR